MIIKKESKLSMWMERWFCSSNAKDIGTLYLIFAVFSGLVGTAFSVLIRLELSAPGVQILNGAIRLLINHYSTCIYDFFFIDFSQQWHGGFNILPSFGLLSTTVLFKWNKKDKISNIKWEIHYKNFFINILFILTWC